MKCARIRCLADGLYQPMIRFKASIIPASGKEVLAMIRPKMVLCLRHKLDAKDSEILSSIPRPKLLEAMDQVKAKSGVSANPDRTDVIWIRILGRRTNGPH